MKKSKLLTMVSLLLVLAMTVTACASGNGTAGTASGGNETTGKETTAAQEPDTTAPVAAGEAADPLGKYEEEITVTMVRDIDPSMKFDTSREGYKSLEDNVWTKAYKEQLGINIEYLWTAPVDEYLSKWNVAIAGGDIPDMAIVPGPVYQQLLEAGYVEDMTDYFNEYASDAYKEANSLDGGIAEGFITVDGRMMGLPHVGAQPDNVNLLFLRKDWLDKLNLPVPTTVDELVDTARAFKEAKLGGENTVGLVANKQVIAGQCDLGGFLNGYGVFPDIWVEGSDGQLIYGRIQPEMKDALQKLQDMYKEGLIPQDFAVKDSSQIGQLVAGGQAGIMYGTYWAPLGVMTDNIKNDESAEWICVDGVTNDGSPYVTQGSAALAYYVFVKKGIEHPEAAVKMLNLNFDLLEKEPTVYGTTEDGMEAIWYRFGHFIYKPWKNMEAYQKITKALETGDLSEIKGTATETDYNNIKSAIDGAEGGRQFVPAELVFGPDSTFSHIEKLWNEDRIYVDKFLSTASEYAQQNMTDLNEVLWAEYLKIIMGDDINNFDKAVEVWKSNGGDRITQEVNDWYATAK